MMDTLKKMERVSQIRDYERFSPLFLETFIVK